MVAPKKAFSIEVETEEFNRHIKDFLAGTSVDTNKAIKKFAFDLVGRIIRKTPVDTGRARAGWLVAYSKLGGSGKWISFGKTIPKSRSGKGFSRAQVIKGQGEGSYTEHLGKYMNKWVEIVNGVSYIIFLEYGSSRQAPYGMVRVSMRELRGATLVKDLSNYYKRRWNRFYYGRPTISFGV